MIYRGERIFSTLLSLFINWMEGVVKSKQRGSQSQRGTLPLYVSCGRLNGTTQDYYIMLKQCCTDRSFY